MTYDTPIIDSIIAGFCDFLLIVLGNCVLYDKKRFTKDAHSVREFAKANSLFYIKCMDISKSGGQDDSRKKKTETKTETSISFVCQSIYFNLSWRLCIYAAEPED